MIENHLAHAKTILGPRRDFFWILGGACTGKTTLSAALSVSCGARIVDMDARLYGEYIPLYDPVRHPASFTQFHATNPLDWALSLSWDKFNVHTKHSDAELLSLLATEVNSKSLRGPVIFDGGFSHPELLARIVPAAQILCLTIPNKLRVEIWETAPERADMRSWIAALPQPAKKWATFLEFDRLITKKIVEEAAAARIRCLTRSNKTDSDCLAQRAAAHFQCADL